MYLEYQQPTHVPKLRIKVSFLVATISLLTFRTTTPNHHPGYSNHLHNQFQYKYIHTLVLQPNIILLKKYRSESRAETKAVKGMTGENEELILFIVIQLMPRTLLLAFPHLKYITEVGCSCNNSVATN